MAFLKLLASAVALVGIVVSSGAGAKDWKTIRIGSEGAYAPFNFIDTKGQLAGVDIDIGRALGKQMKAECVFVAQDWDGIIPALLAKKYDVILASMFITEERRKQVSFTTPYYRAAMSHVAPKSAHLTDLSPVGLTGKIIGVQSGTTQAEYAATLYKNSDIREYRTQDEVNLDLASGRLDLAVGDLLPLMDWVGKTDEGKCCELVGKPVTDPKFVGEGVGMAVRQEDNDLREQINAALAAIIADGTYKAINAKYFPINIYSMN